MAIDTGKNDQIRQLILNNFQHEFGHPAITINENPAWKPLRTVGTRLWLDTGDLEEATKLWCAEFEALTTNNTLLNKEVQKGIYDDLIKTAAQSVKSIAPSTSDNELIMDIAFVLNAYHGLQLVKQFDAFVSVELHTAVAADVDRTIEYGRRFYEICPERFIVKVPFTPAGLLGARQLASEGVPINFTLGFSARQNYCAARFTNPAFVNVFMGRLNAFVADNQLGDGQNVGEKATLSTQRELMSLRQAGLSQSKLIGASMRSADQVASLAGLDVYTMPVKVAAAFADNPVSSVSNQVYMDPSVETAPGIALDDFNGATLWHVPDDFRNAVDRLIDNADAVKTPEQLQDHFRHAGVPDFLPSWSDEQLATIRKDGKIPVYQTWQQPLANKLLGLDALMNISALLSFTTDQHALDQRIQSLI